MSKPGFFELHKHDTFTFAEVSACEKLDWLAGYLEMLSARTFAAQFDGGEYVHDLGCDIEMAGKLLRQARRQIVAESNATLQRLHQHGDYVIPMAGHELTVYFEPDGVPTTAQETESQG